MKNDAEVEEPAPAVSRCLTCLSEQLPAADFCPQCGAPVSSYSVLTPFEATRAEGFVLVQAAAKPRSLVILIGLWLIYGAVGIVGFSLLVVGCTNSLLLCAFGAVFLWISGSMIVKTGRRYGQEKTLPKNLSSP